MIYPTPYKKLPIKFDNIGHMLINNPDITSTLNFFHDKTNTLIMEIEGYSFRGNFQLKNGSECIRFCRTDDKKFRTEIERMTKSSEFILNGLLILF